MESPCLSADADEHPKPDAEDTERSKKKPKVNEEEEEAEAKEMAIDGGPSSVAINHVQIMDVDPSLAYRDNIEYGKRDAIRQLQLIKALHTMDFIHFGMPLDEIIEKLKEHKVISTSNVGVEGAVNQRFSRLLCMRRREAYYCILERLVSFSPYIQWDDECDEKLAWLNENGHLPSLCGDVRGSRMSRALDEFCEILSFMERRFHPLIREGHKNVLLAIIKRRSIGTRREVEQGFERYGCLLTTHSDFIENYIEECKQASERYKYVAEQVNLHRAFDLHLDSCNLIQYNSCIDQLIEDERVVTKEFSSLDSELIRESLKAIIYMLEKINELNSYWHCLVTVVNQRRQKGKSELDELLSQLKERGFFEFSNLPCDNAAQENEGSKLHVLIDRAKKVAFPSLPTHDVVQGLLDYSFIFSLNGEQHRLDSVEDRLGYVEGCWEYKAKFLKEEFWLNRVYDATMYDMFGDALSVIDVPSIGC